jgi:hypothetical protein
MTIERIACFWFCLVITPAVAAAQRGSEAPDQVPQGPARTVIDRTYAVGGAGPRRIVQTRSETGGREVVIETFEKPDLDSRLAPVQEVIVETIRSAPDTAQTRRDVFEFLADHRRRLVETTLTQQDTLPNGDLSAVHNTWAPDLDGRLRLTSRQIEQTRAAAADVRQSSTTLLEPSVNETLRETERSEYTERRIRPGVVQYESAHLVREVNGRWQPTEMRRREARERGPSDRMEEETIERLDLNGKLIVDERNVTRRSDANGQEHVVIETYAPYADGFLRHDSELALSQRLQRTTRTTADGGRHTVEDVEGRSQVAPGDPLRLIRRTVTTVRPIGGQRWVTERQVFERDVNGRLALLFNDVEERTGR